MFEKDKDIEDYKKLKGLPIRSTYIPLENYFPVLEGSVAVEAIEIEQRTLRSVMRNKLFDQEAVATISGSTDKAPSIKDKITILHYCNQKIYAYFALGQTTKSSDDGRTDNDTGLFSSGQPVLLHAYEHDIGRVIYNSVAGRFGGWKSTNNGVEGVSNALLDLNQKGDEVMSQVLTNIRARYWPTHIHKVDSDRRGYQSGSPPKPINNPEGQSIAIFKDESIEPLFKEIHDEAVPWFMGELKESISQLAGSGTLFGQRSPGVETGYHQNLQITQAEHLDEKIEQHVAWGAVQRGTIMLKHIRRAGDVFVNHIDVDEITGARSSKFTKIVAKDLSPMPRLSAQVRKPRPIDFAAAARTGREVTDERGGKGPLLSDDTAREEILGITQPDIEKRKILVETEQRKLLESGVISLEIQKKLAILLAQESQPEVDASDASAADPALTSAITTPLRPGQPPGQSQPEAANGREIANADVSSVGSGV